MRFGSLLSSHRKISDPQPMSWFSSVCSLMQRLLMKFGKLSKEFSTFWIQNAFFPPARSHHHSTNQPVLESVLFPLVIDAASGWDQKVLRSSKASIWVAWCEKEVCQWNNCLPSALSWFFASVAPFSSLLEFAKIFLASQLYRYLCRHLECPLRSHLPYLFLFLSFPENETFLYREALPSATWASVLMMHFSFSSLVGL